MSGNKASGRITIDPVTRIEGHLKIDVELKDGVVSNAWSSAQLFRGLELIVKGRPPDDVHNYVQRTCGVCTTTHSLVSIRAVENAMGLKPPVAAELVRLLILGTLVVHDHLVHFYHLHSLDFFDMADALKADPVAAARLAGEVSGREAQPGDYFVVQSRLKKFVGSGQLGWLSNAYSLGGHPSYRLSPEENLVLAANYLQALRVQANIAKSMAIFSGKNPHSQTMRVGGVTCYDSLRPERLAEFRALHEESLEFINHNYVGDLTILGRRYPEAAAYGRTTNFLDFSDFYDPETGKNPFFRGGIMWARDFRRVEEFDPGEIKEHVTRGWYKPSPPAHPYDGVTDPDYTGYDPDGRYSWAKAPRYKGEPMETGPLARRAMAYARGDKETVNRLNAWFSACRLEPENLFSTMGRTAARMVEAVILANRIPGWLDELEARAKAGPVEIFKPWKMPDSARGVGFCAVTRGGLSHWIRIEKGRTANYQLVVPSTWNLGPRCAAGKLSPVEESLVGVSVADSDRPVELLRTVHSFDPCIACAVHLIEADKADATRIIRVV
ncbi:nickel-dependent hydrogenase large subunit [Desulfovibrio sp. X2]|uniref:nickel-dependent hydrogenase large subunit n=1 Tax=Desulfovibrio sp. X2 TaxID=941449 RepID=UPI0003589458|nr:nickel-dependent hydrogenase large subunit [Desulfovibrio sp. X2]EPR41665.1 nickel-dependent hydrogenase large subunit [Desulfovibrio sp. X2]